MIILAIDPGTRTGIAIGDSRANPDSFAILLAAPITGAPEDRAATLAARLIELIREHKPELIAIEAFLPPHKQLAMAPAVISLMLHGAVAAISGLYKIPLISIAPATWRKHFLGKSPKGRFEIKSAVIDRAHLIGYLPKDVIDSDRAEALGIWDYAAAKYGRAIPKELLLFRH